VRKALATLPWVEQSSIHPVVARREVSFKLTERSAWNEEAVRQALKDANFPEMTVKSLPP
jgi:hypothetical protein